MIAYRQAKALGVMVLEDIVAVEGYLHDKVGESVQQIN
jgi:hypothetical protein